MKLYDLTIHETVDLLEKGDVDYLDVVKAYIDRIGSVEGKVNALLKIMGEEALENVAKLDCENSESSLKGIPYGLKDNICSIGIETTCASNILDNFNPPYDATVVRKLKESGSIMLAKTNMDEFGIGSSTEKSSFKKTFNPWNFERVPGGSSGGSAAGVAAGEVAFALGSDTGGSIRQPASFCGVVGLKPTYGMVSRYGLIAVASSLEQVGPITKDVRDCAIVFNEIYGYDSKDSTSIKAESRDYTRYLDRDISGMKIGVPNDYFRDGTDAEVESSIKDAIKVLKDLGAEIVSINMSHADYSLATYYIISSAEASSNFGRFDGIRYGQRAESYDDLIDLYKKSRSENLGNEVKRRIMLGTFALSGKNYEAFYKKAMQVRTLIKEDFKGAFNDCHVILSPTTPTTAFKLGEKNSDAMTMYLSDPYTVPVNLAGLPAMSIPCGFDKSNMPIGLQLIGNHFREDTLFKVSYAFEQATEYHKKRAKI